MAHEIEFYRDHCGCNEGLHYSVESIEEFVMSCIDDKGPMSQVRVLGRKGMFLVPRHYVALHGVAAMDIPALAMQFGWPQPHQA